MPKLSYDRKRFGEKSLRVIAQANSILEEYTEQGFDLTLRQLYYQFVARDLIPNRQSEYNRLGSIINDARLCGYIDWDHIVDRTRNLRDQPHWDDPADVIRSTTKWAKIDLWEDQPTRLEVWIEKDALVGVIEGVCRELDVPFFSCRGYTSQSEMWSASQRLLSYIEDGKAVRILHLGDHDPSGIDMTRDIEDRLSNFIGQDYLRGDADRWQTDGEQDDDKVSASIGDALDRFGVERLALNMEQVRHYDPPPNPAKMTDSRYAAYIRKYGGQSWELDALEPSVLAGLIRDAAEGHMDRSKFNESIGREKQMVTKLKLVSQRWPEIEALLDE